MSILSIQKMQAIKPCSRNNDARLKQIIAETEFLELQNLIGKDIYAKLVQDCERNPIPQELQSILDDGLYQTIAYFTYANYIQEISVVDTFTGMVQKQREDAQPISVGTIKNLAIHSRELAEQYYDGVKERLNQYYGGCGCQGGQINDNFSEIISVRRYKRNTSGISFINM